MLLIIILIIISAITLILFFNNNFKIPKIILLPLLILTLIVVFIKFGQFLFASIALFLPIIFKLAKFLLANLSMLRFLSKFKRKSSKKKTASIKISKEEAYKILGLEKDASINEVKDRYKELIKYNHPDKGGSEYLASLINEAKNILTKK
jgi:biopolymer transport protein ExbB/TolQ